MRALAVVLVFLVGCGADRPLPGCCHRYVLKSPEDECAVGMTKAALEPDDGVLASAFVCYCDAITECDEVSP